MITRALIAGAALCLAGQTAVAETSFADLISDSIGYVNIRENVILVEDDYNQFLCRVDISDTAFDAYAEGKGVTKSDLAATCIPFEEFKD